MFFVRVCLCAPGDGRISRDDVCTGHGDVDGVDDGPAVSHLVGRGCSVVLTDIGKGVLGRGYDTVVAGCRDAENGCVGDGPYVTYDDGGGDVDRENVDPRLVCNFGLSTSVEAARDTAAGGVANASINDECSGGCGFEFGLRVATGK